MKQSVAYAATEVLLIILFGAVASVTHATTPHILLGDSDGVALDQPRVAVELVDDSGPSPVSLGPTFSNTFLLDTGATSMLAGGLAVTEMADLGANLTAGTHLEQGIAGFTLFDVSAPYRFDFSGTNGIRQTLSQASEDVRILTNSSIALGSFGGIVGTPSMVDRISSLDYTVWSGGNIGLIGVDFPETLTTHNDRYTAPLNLLPFPPTGSPPLPTAAPLPFLSVKWSNGANEMQGNVVVDTGAQISAIDTDIGFGIGLDSNMDSQLNSLDANWLFDQQISGIGGSVTVPVFNVGRIMVPTDQGIDLAWTNMAALVVDIDPSIDGLFGSDLMTSGWFSALFLGGADGYLEQIHFDLTDAANLNGTMVFDLNPTMNVVVPEPNTLWSMVIFGLVIFRRRH